MTDFFKVRLGVAALFLMALAIIPACSELLDDSVPYLPASEGPSGTVIVVMEDRHWNGSMGNTVRQYIEEWQQGLPFPGERIFTVLQKAPHEFNHVLQVNKNIIVAHVKDLAQYAQAQVKYNPDLWAKGQMVVQIYAKDEADFNEAFHAKGDEIVATFNGMERKRLQDKYAANPNGTIKQALTEKHHLSLITPSDFTLAEDYDNFVWLKRHRIRNAQGYQHDVAQDIFIYYYDYTDTNTFTTEYICAMRDSIGYKYVHGSTEGSYMAVSYDDTVQLPVSMALSYSDNYAMEVRGLSKLIGDFRGGPFISLTVHDPGRNRIIVIDGMVHAPQFDKREYLREVEAIIYSLEIL